MTFASNGGQDVEAGNLAFQYSGGGEIHNASGTDNQVNDGDTWATVSDGNAGDSVSAGEEVTFVREDDSDAETVWTEGDTVTLVWQDEGQSSTMATWEAP